MVKEKLRQNDKGKKLSKGIQKRQKYLFAWSVFSIYNDGISTVYR